MNDAFQEYYLVKLHQRSLVDLSSFSSSIQCTSASKCASSSYVLSICAFAPSALSSRSWNGVSGPLGRHCSPFTWSTFCPRKIDHISGPTWYPSYWQYNVIKIGTMRKWTLQLNITLIRGSYKRPALYCRLSFSGLQKDATCISRQDQSLFEACIFG